MRGKQLCRQCYTEMVAFGIYLNAEEKEGYICPCCGFWIYERKKVDKIERSALWLARQNKEKERRKCLHLK